MAKQPISRVLASPYLRLFWDEYKIDVQRVDYNISFSQIFSNQLDLSHFAKSLKKFVNSYYLFQCTLEENESKLYWHYQGKIKRSPLIVVKSEDKINDLIKTPFNLNKGKLYRFVLCRKNDSNIFTVILHHVLIDGSSVNQLINQISNFYNDAPKKFDLSLYEQSKLINECSKNQYQIIEKIKYGEQYWRKYIGQQDNIFDKNFIKSNLQENIINYNFKIGGVRLVKIYNIAEKYDIGIFSIIKILFAITLAKYSFNNQATVHYPIAIKEGTDLVYGASLNTLIYPLKLNNQCCFDGLLKDLKKHINNIKKSNYHRLPVGDIVLASDIKGLHTLLAESSMVNRKFKFSGVRVKLKEINKEYLSGAEFSMLYEIDHGGIKFVVKSKNKLFGNDGLRTFSNYFLRLMDFCLASPKKRLLKFDVFTNAEKNVIKKLLNNSGKIKLPRNNNIVDYLDQIANRYPDKIALAYKNKKMTYRQVVENSVNLAYLVEKHLSRLGGSCYVPLFVDRGFEMIVGIIAILRTGRAYVPIRLDTPSKKVDFILSDINAKLIITSDGVVFENPKKIEVICCKINNSTKRNSRTSFVRKIKNLYVMYTSGTTGLPKGVVMKSAGVLARILHMKKISQVNSKDVCLFKTSYAFDVSFSDIFVCLLSAAKLVISENNFNISEIVKLINIHKISIAHFSPSQFDFIKKHIANYKFKTVNFSGEKLTIKTLRGCDIAHKNIVNYYGPTETGEATAKKIDNYQITIGKPIANFKVYVLDKFLNLLPIGAIGMLYVSGPGLARGYLNNKTITSERFIKNPYNDTADSEYSMMYCTGDIVKWLDDGDLLYLGRLDEQLKINGIRFEPSEIESILIKYSNMVSVKVMPIKNSGLYNVVCYYISDKEFSDAELIDYLSKWIQISFIPKEFIRIDQFPLNANGKLMLNVLEKLYFNRVERKTVPPKAESEKKIALIWADILGAKKISRDSNFFALGGNSLSALKLLAELQNNFNKNYTITDIYKYPILNEMALQVVKTSKNLLTLLNDKKSSQKLYFIHTARGSAEVYQPFSKLIKFSCLGIESFNIYNEKMIVDINKIANEYINLISFHKNDSIVICGWSFGGLIAFKLACLMQSRNIKAPKLIVLFDTITPRVFYDMQHAALVDNAWENRLSRYGFNKEILTREMIHKIIDAGNIHEKMMLDAHLEIYHGDLLLIKAKGNSSDFIHYAGNDYGWSKFVKGKFMTALANGDHESMFDSENIEYLAALFKKYL